jgi:NitT/TauT family transport system substrate-binding protein
MKRMLKIFFFSALFILTAFHAGSGEEKRLIPVSFIPQWVPQAQFAGYYVAYEKGIYKKYGLDVAIINGGPHHKPSDFLESRRADFATFWLATGIQRRARGIPYVNIAQIIQKSALMLVAKKSSGIVRPEDINNKRVGLWGEIFQIQPLAFFKKYNLHVKVVPQSLSVNLFLRGGVDVTSAMWYNEYHTILNSGYNPEELTTFFFRDYGLNFPEDGIYMLEERFKKNPSIAYAFAKASMEGWAYAFDHPDEALDIILKYMEESYIPANRMHQRWMLSRMRDLILVNEKEGCVGRLNAKDYYRVARILKESGIINRIPEFTDFYKDCLVNKK